MKLWLANNDYKYAAEQIMLMMFPDERPEYPETAVPAEREQPESSAVLTISKSAEWTTATARLRVNGRTAKGISRARTEELKNELITARVLQKILKKAFYKAAVDITGKKPVWGSLTGIRPGKIVTGLLESGLSKEAALRYMQKEYDVTRERAALCVDTATAGLKVKRSLTECDIALYVGIPFCPTRCAYCSFVSVGVEKSLKLIEPFLEALDREIDAAAESVRRLGLNIVSVYIGGGTPTTLTAEQLDTLLKRLYERFELKDVSDYTVEAGRPDTITPEKIAVLHDNGVSRISINPQSMSDDVLRAIGRKHTAEDIVTAYETARAAGIEIINMDLIAGLPDDTAEGFKKTLDSVLDMAPENITVHTLSLKKGSRIMLDGTVIPPAEEVRVMLDYAGMRLRERQYAPYYLYRQKFMSGGFENVGWSRSGYENLYNILIMEEFCSIIALGGGGSTKLVSPARGGIKRVANAKYPLEFIGNIDKAIKSKDEIVRFYEEKVLRRGQR